MFYCMFYFTCDRSFIVTISLVPPPGCIAIRRVVRAVLSSFLGQSCLVSTHVTTALEVSSKRNSLCKSTFYLLTLLTYYELYEGRLRQFEIIRLYNAAMYVLYMCMLNHCLEWDKWVLTNLSHSIDWGLTHLFLSRTSHAWLHTRGVTTRMAALGLYHCRRNVRDS